MVALEEEFERKGFRDFDESEEGTFEEDGHPEIRWKAEALKPEVDLSPQKILLMLTGSEDLAALIPGAAPDEDGRSTLDPRAGALTAMVQAQLTQFGETVKKGVRELRLTVAWGEGRTEHSFTVVTHLVVLKPKETP
jgi:general secretion pathway protein I